MDQARGALEFHHKSGGGSCAWAERPLVAITVPVQVTCRQGVTVCSQPHRAMAYTRRAPHDITHTASASKLAAG